MQKRKEVKFIARVDRLEGRDLQAAIEPVVMARLNPQPLPPVVEMAKLNPQPLPPFAARLNPQPLPPFAARGIIIIGG